MFLVFGRSGIVYSLESNFDSYHDSPEIRKENDRTTAIKGARAR